MAADGWCMCNNRTSFDFSIYQPTTSVDLAFRMRILLVLVSTVHMARTAEQTASDSSKKPGDCDPEMLKEFQDTLPSELK